MFSTSTLDVSVSPFSEQIPVTPMRGDGYYSAVLGGEMNLTPSAWKTPQRPRTGETPRDAAALGTPSKFSITPGPYYRAVFGTPSPSLKYRGVPEAHCSPVDNIGITPARIMGPHPWRSVPFETTPLPSPISIVGDRRIFTPRRLRVQQTLEQRDGANLLDASIFGVPFHAVPLQFTRPVFLPSPSDTSLSAEAHVAQSDAEPVGVADPNTGNWGNETEDNGTDRGSGEDSDAEGGDTTEEGEAEDVVHQAATLTDYIHSQRNAQNGGTDSDGNVTLPFPSNRGHLVAYLEAGLSLRYLFPSTEAGGRIHCHADLDLVGGSSEQWRRRAVRCNESKATDENYQRHVKTKHLRASRVALDHVVRNKWRYKSGPIPRQPKTWLRVDPWDPNAPGLELEGVEG